MLKRISFASALLASTALMAGAASAADLVQEPAPLFNWSGFYIGLNAGGVWGNDNNGGCGAFKDLVGEGGGAPEFKSGKDAEDGCVDAYLEEGPHGGDWVSSFELDDDFIAIIGGGDDSNGSFLAGGQIGINQQYGAWVIGLEADVAGIFGDNGNDITFDYFHSDDAPCDTCLDNYEGTGRVKGGDLDWLATFRARLGFAAGDEGHLLFYGTGGVALAGIQGLSGKFDDSEGEVDWCESDECVFGKADDDIRVGFTVGGGLEWAFADNWSLGAEYLYVGFGDWDTGDSLTFYADDGRAFSFENDLDHLNIVRAKLNWRFP
jgi:outer membrane immunogenic protein